MAKGNAGKATRKQHRSERLSRGTSSVTASAGRSVRRNTATQQRKHKREQVLAQYRAASGLDAPPKVITIVSTGEVDTAALSQLMLSHGQPPTADGTTPPNVIVLERQRQRFALLRPVRKVQAVLEAAKAADILLLLIPSSGLDELGEHLVDAICMQGVGTVVGVLQGVGTLPPKQQATARKKWAASLEARFPENARLFSDDVDPDCSQLMRHLCALTPRPLGWRKSYSYVLAHSYLFTPDVASAGEAAEAAVMAPQPAQGTLEICGYLRSRFLSANRLVHIPGVGEVQPSK